MKTSLIKDVQLLSLPKIHTESGDITSINNKIDVDFTVKRCYYLYDIPGGAARGGHAHRNLHQLIVSASGSFEVIIDDATHRHTIHLYQPDQGLYLPPGLWRELDNFSAGSICLVLASEKYIESDYIRDYLEYQEYKKEESI